MFIHVTWLWWHVGKGHTRFHGGGVRGWVDLTAHIGYRYGCKPPLGCKGYKYEYRVQARVHATILGHKYEYKPPLGCEVEYIQQYTSICIAIQFDITNCTITPFFLYAFSGILVKEVGRNCDGFKEVKLVSRSMYFRIIYIMCLIVCVCWFSKQIYYMTHTHTNTRQHTSGQAGPNGTHGVLNNWKAQQRAAAFCNFIDNCQVHNNTFSAIWMDRQGQCIERTCGHFDYKKWKELYRLLENSGQKLLLNFRSFKWIETNTQTFCFLYPVFF